MAKKYGGRWQIVDSVPLGSGGQGTVFRVTDLTMRQEGEGQMLWPMPAKSMFFGLTSAYQFF